MKKQSTKSKSKPTTATSRRAPAATATALAKGRVRELEAVAAAIGRSQATIEFKPDGTILTANDNFLAAVGYTLAEVQGQHHSIFVEPAYKQSMEYRMFWEKLARGEYDSGEYLRVGKGGKQIWIQASYNPILDEHGVAYKVVKFASDVTAQKLAAANALGQLSAIGKSQAVIEFTLDGRILTANDNFLQAVGYSLAEVQGQHHSIFVDATHRQSVEYRMFWEKLGRGEFDAGEYLRVGKGGREIWIQASYNPILGPDGKPLKVVKYASDITEAKLRAADSSGQLAAISKAQAVIEFSLDGTIVSANDNFCNTLGYVLAEIKGQHHSMFVEPAERASAEYRSFWERLGRGQYDAGQYLRLGKGGKRVWIQASYNPIFDANGRPYKVVKYATDVTAQKQTLSEGTRIMQRLAEGNLTERMQGEYEGEFRVLYDAVNLCTDNLVNMVNEIQSAATSISSASTEIANGNADLSRRTEQQASSLEETASSIEELTSTVRQNAENAKVANTLASSAREQAAKGGTVVSNAVIAMGAINTASKKIADIISVIDEIAFQTNLLALNAAVEAARAGEQGRGFAVVAAEVRNLAQRSAGAAKEIKALINDSVEKVSEGSKLVDASGRTLEEIVASVTKVSEIIAEIAAASQEQSVGIEQVNQAITQMDEVTQQNASLVEEAAAAAEAMDEQAKGLAEQVGFFKVDAAPPVRSPLGAGRAPAAAVRPKTPVRSAAPPVRAPQPRARPLAPRAATTTAAAGDDEEWAEF